MSEPKGDHDHDPAQAQPAIEGASGPDRRSRRPYQKPQFVREQLFETMALACGKTNPSIGQCKAVRKSS
ncbi:MAG TPA: hypothetical protein VF219_20540 [Vicinamibacterales bacterium]